MKKECVTRKNWKFLWIKGTKISENHDWFYTRGKSMMGEWSGESMRECNKCGRKEILWATNEIGEDWRLTP